MPLRSGAEAGRIRSPEASSQGSGVKSVSVTRGKFSKVRTTVETGVLRTLAPRRGGGNGTDRIYARAQVERVRLTEHYYYEQEISRNPANRRSALPTGRIELTIPYDGHSYVTRQARADIAAGLGGPAGESAGEALVGHLLLARHAKTNLGDLLDLNNRYGAVPIRLPIARPPGRTDLDQLTADQQTCVISYDYAPRPDEIRLIPVHVDAELLDPDSIDLPGIDDMTSEGSRLVADVAQKITQQVSFRPHLLLHIVVSLDIPRIRGQEKLRPKVARLALDWPTITSLAALHLSIDEQDVPITYNPVTRSLEWSDVAMSAVAESADGDTQTYRSADMLLFVEQPGELYQQPSLDGLVEVEIPGYLLSGVTARLHDGVGARSGRQPEPTSRISTALHLILDDAFARRTLSPFQHLHFDEVIPDEMRIADIVTALKDRGFDVVQNEPVLRHGESSGAYRRFLLARRSEGPDTMGLWLFVEGRRYTTERQNVVPGGHKFTSTLESGELKVFMRGTLPRDSRELTHEMNALQHALRERFERLRARR
jgi:hypothetical protein